MAGRALEVIDLGRCAYAPAWARQKELHARVISSRDSPAYLVLVEHPPVITLGRGADRANVLAGEAELAERGIEVLEVDRGGDVTYHGPGQLVAYPILRLEGERRDVNGYFRSLEGAVIALLGEYGITAGREEGLTGVWVGDGKICSMGVAIRRWITYHGLALNVSPELDHFRLIRPCGIVGKGVTSMEEQLGRAAPLAEVGTRLVRHFAAEFGFARPVE